MDSVDKAIAGWAIVVWLQLVAYALGMITANYLNGSLVPVVIGADLLLISASTIKWRYRWRAFATLGAILILHIAVLMRPDDQPMAYLPLGVFSMVVLLISFFIPNSDSSKSSSPRP